MSTLFYDAYRCPHQNITLIMAAFTAFRKKVHERQRVRYAGLFRGGIRSQHQIDHPEQYKVQRRGWSSPTFSGDDDLTKAIERASGILRGERGYSFVCSAMVYAHPIPSGPCAPGEGESIVQFFGLERELESEVGEVVSDILGSDYHYQNSSDRPKGVKAKEWETRKRVVDILSEQGPPSKNGLSYEFLNEEEALEILWTEFARKNPPPHLKDGWPTERKNDGFSHPTPESAGMFKAQDYRWAWKNTRRPQTEAEFERELRERFNPVLDSLDSACL